MSYFKGEIRAQVIAEVIPGGRGWWWERGNVRSQKEEAGEEPEGRGR